MKRKLPDTSISAKNSFTAEMKEAHHAKILEALDKLGIGIYTDFASVSGLEPHAVARRLKELEPPSAINPKGLNKVWKPGGRKNTPSGRPAYLYQLVGEPVKTDAAAKELRYKANETTAAEHAVNLINKSFQQPVQQEMF